MIHTLQLKVMGPEESWRFRVIFWPDFEVFIRPPSPISVTVWGFSKLLVTPARQEISLASWPPKSTLRHSSVPEPVEELRVILTVGSGRPAPRERERGHVCLTEHLFSQYLEQ